MKNYLMISIVVIMSIFCFGIGSVKADFDYINFDYENLNLSDDYIAKINDIRSIFLENWQNIILWYNTEDNIISFTDSYDIYFFTVSKTSSGMILYIDISKEADLLNYNASFSNVYNSYHGWTSNNSEIYPFVSSALDYMSYSFKSFSVNLDTYVLGSYEVPKSFNYSFKTNSKGAPRAMELKGSVKNLSQSSVYSFLYDTNANITYRRVNKGNSSRDFYLINDFQVNGISLNDGDKFPTYLDYKNNNSNTFDEIINVNQYSQVEFTFELPTSSQECTRDEIINGLPTQVTYECPLLDLNYDIRNTDLNGNYDDMNMTFGIPYLYYKHLEDTGSSSITKIDTIPLGEFIDNRYTGNYTIESTTSGLSLKLIVPFEHIYATYVRIYFDSNLKYTVNYVERETDINYMETVDFTGKYAVTFKPKQISEDMLLGFGFGVEGLYAVQLRDSYYTDYNILKYYTIGYCDGNELNNNISTTCNNNSYLVYFDYKKGNIEQVVTVVNQNYGNEKIIAATVTYDTRYFSYVIHDTPTSKPTMKDPITGDDITLGDLSNFDVYLFKDKNDSFFQMFTNAFNSFKSVIIEIFQNLTYFYNSLPAILQNFFIVIFTFVLFMFLIRFIL